MDYQRWVGLLGKTTDEVAAETKQEAPSKGGGIVVDDLLLTFSEPVATGEKPTLTDVTLQVAALGDRWPSPCGIAKDATRESIRTALGAPAEEDEYWDRYRLADQNVKFVFKMNKTALKQVTFMRPA